MNPRGYVITLDVQLEIIPYVTHYSTLSLLHYDGLKSSYSFRVKSLSNSNLPIKSHSDRPIRTQGSFTTRLRRVPQNSHNSSNAPLKLFVEQRSQFYIFLLGVISTVVLSLSFYGRVDTKNVKNTYCKDSSLNRKILPSSPNTVHNIILTLPLSHCDKYWHKWYV